MAFKLKSGNSPVFKKIGSKKESVEEYNARLKEQYEDQMKSYADSTTAYENKKQYIEKFEDAYETRAKMHDLSMENKGTVDWVTGDVAGEKSHYRNPDGSIPERKLTNKELAMNTEFKKMSKEFIKKTDEGFAIHEKNLDLGIYTQDGGDYKNPNDLRPKVIPKEPAYKIDTKGLKRLPIIDTGKNKIEPVRSKRKYVTSADGKTKTNIETKKVTKVKTKKVKGKRKPGKRKVRNLITGKNNKIM